MRTVIFDLDGTLADTSGDLIAAANACFDVMGVAAALDPVADAATALRGGKAMLRLGLTRVGHDAVEDLVEAHYKTLLAQYARAICVHTTMYPGAMDAVQALRAAGYGVGICTNKPEGLAEDLMRALGVRDQFGALIGADTLPVRKPDPAPLAETVRRLGGDMSKSILVGDTDTDRNTARAAGVASVLVTFGPGQHDVAALEPEALLHDYADLLGIVQRLIG